MSRLRRWAADRLIGAGLWLDPVKLPFFDEDDAPLTPISWAGMLVLHAEAIHGCDHTAQARQELGMFGPRGLPAEDRS